MFTSPHAFPTSEQNIRMRNSLATQDYECDQLQPSRVQRDLYGVPKSARAMVTLADNTVWLIKASRSLTTSITVPRTPTTPVCTGPSREFEISAGLIPGARLEKAALSRSSVPLHWRTKSHSRLVNRLSRLGFMMPLKASPPLTMRHILAGPTSCSRRQRCWYNC